MLDMLTLTEIRNDHYFGIIFNSINQISMIFLFFFWCKKVQLDSLKQVKLIISTERIY